MTTVYHARAREHAARRGEEERRSARISAARLVVFLTAVLFLVWTIATRQADPLRLSIAAVFFAVFAVLVGWHARVEERVAWHDALHTANLRGAARVERRWDDLPPADSPAAVDLSHHPYAIDLDLFGRASLFQWLGPSATPYGARALANWLLHPADPDTITSRQTAVAELAPLVEWREQFAAHGLLARAAREIELEAFLAWAESAPLSRHFALPFRRGWHGTLFFGALYGLACLLMLAIWILLALFLLGVTDAALWLIPLVAGLVLSFAMGPTFQSQFEHAGTGQQSITRYAALFTHVTSPSFASPLQNHWRFVRIRPPIQHVRHRLTPRIRYQRQIHQHHRH